MNIYKGVQATKLSASNIYTSYPVFNSQLQTVDEKRVFIDNVWDQS